LNGFQPDCNAERNITSSDIEYLLGDSKDAKAKTSTSAKKTKKDKESTRTTIDNTRRMLSGQNPDLSVKRKADHDIDGRNDVM
jgi:hypothetical protein